MRALVVVVLLASGAARAEKMSAEDLERKNEDGYVTGLPLVAYSSDFGFGAGARAYYFYDGKRSDERFATTPYLFRTFLQVFFTTKGTQFHWLDVDVPHVAGTPYRLRAQFIYPRVLNSNYFGLGSASLQPLQFPGTTNTYSTQSAYNDDEKQIYAGGTTYGKYDQYDLERPFAIASIERLLLGDKIRVLGGLGFSHATIRTYGGQTIDATGGQAIEAPTHLEIDRAAGKVVGGFGGWDNYFRFGVSYDTRDFEPDPNRGVFADAALDVGTVALGSEFNYARFMLAARGYWSPIAKKADLVLAGRAVFLAQTKGAPFFSMDTFPFTEDPRTGLGGHRTMRGFLQDRFVGSVMTLGNVEVRWTFWHFTLWKQKLAVMVVPFVDVGRPYDDLSQLQITGWRADYGGALRISWNLATIITVDYGRSSEDSGFYINFNHIF